jgi:hypothetical protein
MQFRGSASDIRFKKIFTVSQTRQTALRLPYFCEINLSVRGSSAFASRKSTPKHGGSWIIGGNSASKPLIANFSPTLVVI